MAPVCGRPDALIVLLTKNVLRDGDCLREVCEAIEQGIPLVSVLVGGKCVNLAPAAMRARALHTAVVHAAASR